MNYLFIMYAKRALSAICMSLFLLFSGQLSAADFFIRLTDNGLSQRAEFIQDKFKLNTILKKPVESSAQPIHFNQIVKFARHSSEFDRWLVLSDPGQNSDSTILKLKMEGIIDFAEAVGKFHCHKSAEDSLADQQWYLKKIDVFRAWEIWEISDEIIVGVIDTGIDYTHPDLQGSVWINDAEQNGMPGADDDGNGFVDDYQGWDFTDAPQFPDGGDFKDPDNDPMDEFSGGHGTEIAGIIAAQSNQIGVAGIAPGIKIMNLRAGTASGYLEEDDVARAIFYAVENGARVINMSFGDVALSRLLREVIYYAAQQSVVMVASAGNSGTNEVNYPAGLSDVIAVAASTESDGIAGFSCFGAHVDIAAPGVNILSTAPDNSYNSVNGTSFSAPVVAALAAMSLASNPEWTAERVRHILKTSSDDIMYQGWDQYSGSGRVNAFQMLKIPYPGILQISQPLTGSSFAGDTLWVTGSSIDPDLLNTIVSAGTGENPAGWEELISLPMRQISDDTLASLKLTALPDTTLTIRLQQILIGGRQNEVRVNFRLDRSAPVISDVEVIPVFSGPQTACRISFRTDDVCKVRIHLRDQVNAFLPQIYEPGYESVNHAVLIDKFDAVNAVTFDIEAVNRSELIANSTEYQLRFDPYPAWQTWRESGCQLPSGYLLDKMVDLDHNGRSEIILSRYNDDGGFGNIEAYEFNGLQYSKVFQTEVIGIPRDAGDVDNDGRSDLLIGYGDRSYLYEAQDTNGFPDRLVWADTSHFWAAAFGDADVDGRGEIFGRTDSLYVVLECDSDNNFDLVASLGNPSAGNNQLGIPKIVRTDLDGDLREELIWGDYDGDILTFSNTGDNQYEFFASGQTHLQDATALITASDGMIFVASHSSGELNYEHEADSRYQVIERFIYDDNYSSLLSKDTIAVYGYHDLRNFDSGINLHWLDNQLYLFAALYPDLYVFKFENEDWIPVFFRADVASNAVVSSNNNGIILAEFYFNTGSEILGCSPAEVSRLSPPAYLRAEALDSARVQLRWSVVPAADACRIYRQSGTDDFILIGETTDTIFLDSLLMPEQYYHYRATSVTVSPEMLESQPGLPVEVRTSYPPKLLDVNQINARQIMLIFNEAVQLSQEYPFEITLLEIGWRAGTAAVLSDSSRMLAGFDHDFPADFSDTIQVSNIFDRHSVPVDKKYQKVKIVSGNRNGDPYVQAFELTDRFHIRLTFSERMDRISLLSAGNYVAEPGGISEGVTLLDSSGSRVEVKLPVQAMAGGLGKDSYLNLINLKNTKGVLLTKTDRIHLYSESSSLNEMVVYPQPAKPHHTEVIFAKVTAGTEIFIYSINGMLIRHLESDPYFGGVHWDMRDNGGNIVQSGIYLYRAENHSESKTGKLLIVR